MFNLFPQKKPAQIVKLKLDGLHCTSCSLSIDMELEALTGVKSSKTSYATQVTVVSYDSTEVNTTQFSSIIEGLGYKVISIE